MVEHSSPEVCRREGAFVIFSYNGEFNIFYSGSQIPTILFQFKNNSLDILIKREIIYNKVTCF